MEEFRLCKWECEDTFLKSSIKLSPNFDVVALLVNRTLNFYSLKESAWLISNHVIDFCFEENAHLGKSRVLIINGNGLLTLNEICDDVIKISEFSNLSAEIQDDDQIRFLGFSSGFASILTAENSVLIINIEENSTLALNLAEVVPTSIKNIKFLSNFIYVLTNEVIYKICNSNGKIKKRIQIHNCIEEKKENICQFYLSSDETSVVIVFEDGNCVYLEMEEPRSQIKIHVKNPHKTAPKVYSYWDIMQKNIKLDNNDEIIKKIDEDYLMTMLKSNSSIENNDLKIINPKKIWNFLPNDCQIESAEICSNFVYLVCISTDGLKKLLLIERKSGKQIESLKLNNDNVLLFGVNNGNPNLILSKDYISVLIYLPKQEMLLNKMMVYSDTPLADKILQLNSWQDVALPLTFLDWGLNNHQLGLVALYLKSQKKAWNGCRSLTETLQLNNEMMKLIFSVIDETRSQGYSLTFVEQILKLTLQYLTSILSDCLIKCEDRKKFEQFVVYFMKKTRTYLKSPIKMNKNIENAHISSSNGILEKNKSMDLCEALLERRLPLLQNNLRQTEKSNSLKQIEAAATKLIMDHIVSRDLKMARKLLNNLGIDADLHLQGVIEVIIHRKLRGFLLNNLTLSDEYLYHVNLLEKFEKYYPSTSFSSSKEELLLLTPNWNKNCIVIKSPDLAEITWNNTDTNDEEINIRSPYYSNLRLHWVQRMTRDQIEFALFDRSQDDNCDWRIEWRYKLSRNEIDFQNLVLPSPVSLEFVNKELDQFSCLPLTRELCKIHLTKLGYVNQSDALRRAALASTLSRDSSALKCLIEIFNKYNYTNILFEFKDEVNLLLGADFSPTLRLINTFLEEGSVVVACFDQVSMFVNANNSRDVVESLKSTYPLAAAYCLALPNCKYEIKQQLKPVLNHSKLSPFLLDYLSEVNDISLYQLLQDSVSFNISRLFAKNNSENSENCIPSPFITEAHHEVTLDFLYYLRQSRPCFAYLQFLLQEGNRSTKINKRRLQIACALATSLAFANSSSSSISASCVVFIELLNMPSDWLRLNLEAVCYLRKSDLDVDHSNVENLVEVLEDNLRCEQPTENLASFFIQKLHTLKVLVKLCNLCKLELPTKCLNDWDWLLALIIAQQCNYKVSKMRKVFNNWNHKDLIEHIHMALQQTIMEQKRANQIKSAIRSSQSSRDILYRKLGLVECVKKPAELKDETRPESPISMLSDDLIMSPDLLQNVIICYDSQYVNKALCLQSISWRNPLFAILCTSQSDAEDSLLAWLSSLLRTDADSFNTAINACFDNCWWSLFLKRGCRLFNQFLPIDLFFASLDSLFNQCCYDNAVSDMDQFLQNCLSIPKTKVNEIESFVWQTLECVFKFCSSQFKIYQLLKILHATNFTSVFSCNVDFGILSCLQKHVLMTPVTLPYDKIFSSVDDESTQVWSQLIIEDLVHANHLNEAEKVRDLVDFTPNILIVFRMQNLLTELEKSSRWQRDARMRHNFWSHCSEMYLKHNIPSDLAGGFFKECSKKVVTQSEKFYLLKLAFKFQPENVDLERNMWLKRIKAQVQMELLNEDCKNFLTSNECSTVPALCTKLSILKNIKDILIKSQQIEDEESIRAIKEIINQELDQQRILEALRISTFFEHENQNLSLVLICIDLAEGTIKPEEVDFSKYQIRSLLFRKSSIPDNKVTEVFEKIIYICKHGKIYCNRIFSYYKVAELLGMNYMTTVERQDVFSTVKSLLKTKTIEGISLAIQLCSDNCIPKEKIVQFISDEVTSLISNTNFEDVSYEVSKAFLHFKELTKLISDTSLVGNQLISMSENDGLSLGSRAELVIWAHFCFSSSCNTEGIALVLQRAHQLITTMEVDNSTLAVRLLTGIGRYNEMLYVFNLLMEWDQFELLLKKGMEKIYFLKTSLLDYLWRFRHANVELFMMTAVRFCLYQEMGDMLFSTADKHLEHASGSQDLNQILQHLADAAESYSKAGCHRYAQKCCRVAELVALQIYFLPSDKRILGLKEDQVQKLIDNHSEFHEAYLISCAYEVKTDWANAIYNNVIINNDIEYLKQFHNCLGVSNAVAEEIVTRFEKEKSPTDKMAKNCVAVIDLLEDVCISFKFGKRLKSRSIDDLINSEIGPFLTDTAINYKII